MDERESKMETSNNTSFFHLPTEDYIFEKFLENKYAIMALYLPVFLSALIANILVILVVFKDQYMRNVTNYFLVNLSVADLFVTLVCMPNAAWRAYTTVYDFGDYTCRISAYLQCVSVAASIFTITAMAIDRYLAITRPFGFFYRCFNKRTTIIVIAMLWLTSLVLFSPILLVTGVQQITFPVTENNLTIELCKENWENCIVSQRALGIVWFVSMFAVPGILMLFAYSMMGRTLCSVVPPFDNNEGLSSVQQRNKLVRSRKRVACILLLLAFVFAICWLPYHIINLLLDTTDANGDPSFGDAKLYVLLLGHANSALNPIIYCALSRKFRRSIRGLVCGGVTLTRRRQQQQQPIQWADSSGSGTQLHYLHRLKSVPTVHNQLHYTLTRLQSSQKTCAV